MNTLDFLRRVLPSEGKYCGSVAFVKDEGGVVKKGIRNRFFDDVKDLSDYLQLLSERNTDVYYAVSSFVEDEEGSFRRKRENVHRTKLVAIDIDVGKKEHNSYATQEDALYALADFLKRAALPDPVLVSSGMGLHCYWVLDRDYTLAEWQPLADALKACWQSYGLKADPAVTADSARILRPVGTIHTKSGNTVRLLRDAPDMSLDSMLEALSAFVVSANAAALPDYLRGRKSSEVVITQKVEHPPTLSSVVESKCQQVARAIKNPEKVDEPIWYALMGVAAYTADPEETAKCWSEGHPEYSEAETLAKLKQWKDNASGPATCEHFNSLDPSGCSGCPYRGKITTPAALGRAYEEAPVDVSAPDPVARDVTPPWPFSRARGGIIKMVDGAEVDVCPFDLYPVGYGKDEVLGYETVRFHWNRPRVGWTQLAFRQALLVDGNRDFPTMLADNGLLLGNTQQIEDFRVFMRGYLEELRKYRDLSNLYSSMGWKEAATQFVLGNTIIRKNEEGSIVEESTMLSKQADKNSEDMYGQSGTLEAWVEGTKILELADMPWHMFTLNMGFAAPLFNFTGLKGLTVSLYGPTGGGKTLSQYWVQSIYGDPDKLHFAAKFTQNALFSRLGLYNNLPMTIDEATVLQDKEVGDFIYCVSQGRDKARLNRATEEREAKTWATPVILSTNVSMQSKLISSGIETDAQMARLLEVRIPQHELFKRDSTAGQKIYTHLMSNYGTAGREFLKALIDMGEDALRKKIDKAKREFGNKYGAHFAGEERFWETAIVLQDVAAGIAKDLGLIDYDYTKGTKWVVEQVGAIRHTAVENRLDTFDLLNEYLNEVSDCAVTVLHTGSRSVPDMSRCPRGEIRVRFDVYRTKSTDPFEKGALYLDRSSFRRWLALRGADYKSFIADLDVEGINVTPKAGRAMLGKDTPIKVGLLYVVGIDLTHPRLIGILNDADEAMERVALTKLKLVDNVVTLGDKK